MNIQGILAELRQERERISKAISALESIGSTHFPQRSAGSATEAASSGRKRRVSAKSRRRMAEAQRARWAKVKTQADASQSRPVTANVTPIKRTMSASARRKIAAAQRARWAKVKKAA